MRRKNVARLVCCYVGAVIGAGFASGQELLTFFVRHGAASLPALAGAGVLFGVYGAIMLRNLHTRRAQSLAQYFSATLGRQLCTVLEAIVYAFMFASFCVMVSGSGALLREAFDLPMPVGAIGMAALCFVFFCFGAQGVVRANTVLTPLLAAGVLVVGALSLLRAQSTFSPFGGVSGHVVTSALIYVSYNTLTLIAIFAPLRAYVDSRATAVLTGAISGGVLLVISGVLWLLLYANFDLAAQMEIPMLAIAGKAGDGAQKVYVAVLLLAMITTAVSSGFGLLSRILQKLPAPVPVTASMLCAVSVPLAFVGFSRLVESLYTFFGYAGLFLFFLTLLDGLPRRKK